MIGRFTLDDYDLLSFDLDNTLCEYNIKTFYTLYYQYLINYLVNHKKYKHLIPKLHQKDISFISKGLVIDYEKGNLLKFDKNGVIVRASHGTVMLSQQRIVNIYGPNRSMNLFTETLDSPFNLLAKSCTNKLTPIVDYSNAALSLVYAKAIDVGESSGKTISQIRNDVKEAVHSMNVPGSTWYGQLVANLSNLTYRQDRSVVNWLKHLRKLGHIALITSSDKSFAQLVATRSLGNNWQTLFDFIVYSAYKPFFFIRNQPFLSVDLVKTNMKTDFILKGEYAGGSYEGVKIALENKLGRKARMVYFGDSVLNDLTAPPEAVAIIQEAAVENFIPFFEGVHNNNYLTSTQWGSLFFDNHVPTWYGNIVMNTKFCAPSLTYLSRTSLTYEHRPFWQRYKMT